MQLCSWGPQPRGWVFPLRHRIFPSGPALTFSYIWLKACFFDSPHVFNKYIHIIAILSFGSGIFLAVFILHVKSIIYFIYDMRDYFRGFIYPLFMGFEVKWVRGLILQVALRDTKYL